jgi:hypothetical protein
VKISRKYVQGTGRDHDQDRGAALLQSERTEPVRGAGRQQLPPAGRALGTPLALKTVETAPSMC